MIMMMVVVTTGFVVVTSNTKKTLRLEMEQGRGRRSGRRSGGGQNYRNNNNNVSYQKKKKKSSNSYGTNQSSRDENDPFGDYDTSYYNEKNDDDPFGDFDNGYSSMDDTTNFQFSYYDDDDDDDFVSTSTRSMDPPNNNNGMNDRNKHFFSKKSLNDASFVLQNNDDNSNSVDNVKLQRELCEMAGIQKPSRIQALSWPVLVRGEDAIVADQTGSGKTLAYLLPLLQQQQIMFPKKKRQPGCPQILILAPTAELADQIQVVCQKFSPAKLSTAVITAQGKYATDIHHQIRMIQRKSFHILISTPGRMATILRSKDCGGLDLTQVQSVVLDEVDILLMDDTFGPQLRTIGTALSSSSSSDSKKKKKTQFIFVTATLPDSVKESVKEEFGKHIPVIQGPGLHRVAPTVTERLVDVSVSDNRNDRMCFEIKAKELQLALRQTTCERTLVFCNTVESCRKVENLLKRQYDRKNQMTHISSYHNAMSPQARRSNLSYFVSSSSEGKKYILVCTDRAARGVDFEESPVDHVILFDFPKDPAEYVRRVGRTARAGRKGTTTVFAYGWQLPIARTIMGGSNQNTKQEVTTSSFATSSSYMDDDEEDEEYTAQQRRRQQSQKQKRKQKQKKENMIQKNIQGGKTWN